MKTLAQGAAASRRRPRAARAPLAYLGFEYKNEFACLPAKGEARWPRRAAGRRPSLRKRRSTLSRALLIRNNE
ncbi:hypothetical protein CKA38_10960 [Ereboglobus luteus]|uniref:Uncharacterized protein n=1 Tax=Ereboglobus luteus TaxID=1796921 RepID=A0A2U8E4C6_9BACT|nr:hypothetical protein CKA38_10960 [Ereboglobus luteus]